MNSSITESLCAILLAIDLAIGVILGRSVYTTWVEIYPGVDTGLAFLVSTLVGGIGTCVMALISTWLIVFFDSDISQIRRETKAHKAVKIAMEEKQYRTRINKEANEFVVQVRKSK